MSSQSLWVPSAADENAMRIALDQAHNAWLAGEVPVGAVLMRGGQVIATGYNRARSPPMTQRLMPRSWPCATRPPCWAITACPNASCS